MVGYDDANNALTLGDDDSIAVGDYRIKYSSANDRFEVEHPNGELSDVPRSTSGSLVPQGLAESVSAGEALADDGNTYSSVQDAVNAASGWVFVGPGTFNENVTISTAGLTLEGSGYDTLIDGGTSGIAIEITSSDVMVTNISARTTMNDGVYTPVEVNASNVSIDNVTTKDADDKAISSTQSATGMTVTNCTIETYTGNYGIEVRGSESIVSNCKLLNSETNAENGIWLGANNVLVSGNRVDNAGTDGIAFNGCDDSVIIGNRITNSGTNGINVFDGIDNIVANNRVSDSSVSDLKDGGTGTVLDGNLTGPSN